VTQEGQEQEAVFKMFGLVQIIMPLHARKVYYKPWLQQKRGSNGERSPKKFSSDKKKKSHRKGGKCCEKKQSPHFS
jgi:hypothetical protein